MTVNNNALFFAKVCALVLITMVVKKINAQSYYPAGLPKSKINLWLDANDTNTIIRSAGSVTAWLDKVNGLQAISPASANNPITNTSLLPERNVVEFNGTKVLNINPSGALLDPIAGYNLAQVVYVFSNSSTAATDLRLGTYTRGNTALNRTPAISVRYSTTDLAYQAGIINGSAVKYELRNNWSLLHNYAKSSADTTFFLLNEQFSLNTASKTAAYTSTNVSLGNRQQFYTNIRWAVGETILTGVPLQNSGRKILSVYLAYKWGLQNNLPPSVAGLYS